MAVLTSASIAAVSAAMLSRSLVLPATTTMINSGQYNGPNGGTITVRVPQPVNARVQATPGAVITFDMLDEAGVDVTLTHIYHAYRVTDEDLTLGIQDYAAQVSRPQIEAVARDAEDLIADALNGLTADDTVAANGSDVEAGILAARAYLSSGNAPANNRFLAVSPEVANMILALDKFTRADARGTNTAIEDAIIGRIYGLTVVESNALDAGTAVAYHQSAIAFANATPATPRGAHDSAVAVVNGMGIRHIHQYQPERLSDASVVSTFAGASLVTDDSATPNSPRYFKLETA